MKIPQFSSFGMSFRKLVTERAGFLPVATGVAAVVFHALFFWPGLHPSLWEDYAVAAGLRYPSSALSGVLKGAVACLYACLPAALLETLLRAAGVLSAGVLSFLAYGLLDDFLPSKIRSRLRIAPDGLFLERLILSVCVLVFVCNSFVWRICQAPGVPLYRLLCVLLAVRLTVHVLRGGAYLQLQAVAVLLGLMIGDGLFPVWILLGILVTLAVRAKTKIPVINPLSNPLMMRTVTVRFVFAFAVTAAVTLAANYALYLRFGGVELSTFAPGDVSMVLVRGYFNAVSSVAPLLAWFAQITVMGIPIVLVSVLVRRLGPSSERPSYGVLAVLFLVLAVTWSQVSNFNGIRVDAAVPVFSFRDDFLLSVFTLVGVLILSWTAVALMAGLASREGDWLAVKMRIAVKVLTVIALLGTFPTRGQGALRSMSAVVADYFREVVRESGSDLFILTDGTLDAGLELAAHREGRRLLALSMVSSDDPLAVKLRQRDAADEEDREALASGAADALRYWLDTRTNRLSCVAAQLGFDRRRKFDENSRPRVSGLLAHFGGEPGEAERSGVAAARYLGERILSLHVFADYDQIDDEQIDEKFRFVQWRIAELCRSRCVLAGVGPETPGKIADRELAQRLDEANPRLAAIRRRIGWQAEHHGSMILPREGLKLAIAKSDFRLASEYAAAVLKSEPDDPQANFGMGMFHYFNRQYARALPYLLRALEKVGENPPLLSNIALVHMHLGNLKEALEYGERARCAAPNDRNIVNNVEDIRKRIRERLGAGRK